MSVPVILVVVTAALAVVAVTAAIVAVRAVRTISGQVSLAPSGPVETANLPAAAESVAIERPVVVERPGELAPRVVQGRVIAPPTQAQVVRTALGRPGVRLSVFAHGLARALRPENRDRIVALVRREFRHRRRERLSAGRQAVRMARPTSAPTTDRLHEHLLEPQPLSLTDRMIGS